MCYIKKLSNKINLLDLIINKWHMVVIHICHFDFIHINK